MLICSKRQKSDVAGALNGYRDLTLMFCAISGNAAGQNFSALGNETAQFSRVFVINLFDFIHAKSANFSARASASFSTHILCLLHKSQQQMLSIELAACSFHKVG